jgi:hypothetical protein
MHYMHVVKPYISHSGFTKIIQLKLTGENIADVEIKLRWVGSLSFWSEKSLAYAFFYVTPSITFKFQWICPRYELY